MNQTKSGKLVLIVDDDLGFVMWLGQVLSRAGLVPVPAVNGAEAHQRIRDLRLHIDLALVNPSVAGARDLIEKIESGTSVYTLEIPAARTRGVMKRFSGDEPAADKWVTKVKRALSGA